VIPVTEAAAWYQYDTKDFSGFVTQQNDYAVPSVWQFPDWGQAACCGSTSPTGRNGGRVSGSCLLLLKVSGTSAATSFSTRRTARRIAATAGCGPMVDHSSGRTGDGGMPNRPTG
jgi:hypothetical protein